ncbi:DMT family transporter [Bifidobacterium pseudocatenulatum]|uniref:DMT family transporter n=1 Tax=Bifidobacterium pseudocatenulatum TaxID=28026 RepID=UPI002FD8229E
MLLAALGVLTGIVTPLQTAVNARLRGTLGTPFRASLVSFTVGLAATTIAALLLGPYPLVPESALHGPWWMWFAGLFDVIFMTGNILLLTRLGSLQTVLMPVLGQITLGLLIDQFGWLGNPRHPMTMARALSANRGSSRLPVSRSTLRIAIFGRAVMAISSGCRLMRGHIVRMVRTVRLLRFCRSRVWLLRFNARNLVISTISFVLLCMSICCFRLLPERTTFAHTVV